MLPTGLLDDITRACKATIVSQNISHHCSMSRYHRLRLLVRATIVNAILSNLIKLPFVNKIFVLSIVEWPFYTCFTVHEVCM